MNISNKLFLLSFVCLFLAIIIASCNQLKKEEEKIKRADYIRTIPGKDEVLSPKTIQQGKVLIAYADCYTCHKEEERSFGPAFMDIAERYPANRVFTQMLAHKIITGGSHSWGNAVMLPHPKLSLKDAETMATFILSLEQ
ncbi:MAG: c-type cytochrome [Chitinophagaceae bacterium]|nr:MAG: c-type cytochrome [Chitinophagaceae bacterium]